LIFSKLCFQSVAAGDAQLLKFVELGKQPFGVERNATTAFQFADDFALTSIVASTRPDMAAGRRLCPS
jgi:hypothetical protein